MFASLRLRLSLHHSLSLSLSLSVQTIGFCACAAGLFPFSIVPIHRSAIRRVYAFVSRRIFVFSSILGHWSLIRSIPKSVHSTIHEGSNATSYNLLALALPLCRAYLARLNRLTALQIVRILSQMSCSSSSYLRVESGLRALATSVPPPNFSCHAATVFCRLQPSHCPDICLGNN